MYNINPFAVQTPEDISAEDAYQLFVDVFTDFYQVPNVGHTFLNGPRGSGKSMMFRYMMPDCQKLKTGKSISNLDYFSIYIPIKKTTLNLSNLERVDKHAQFLINEHLLVSYVTLTLFENLSRQISESIDAQINQEAIEFFKNEFLYNVELTGYTIKNKETYNPMSFNEVVESCKRICKEIYVEINNYIKGLFLNSNLIYTGPLCGYLDYLYPIICGLKQIGIFPKDKPFFLLIDDADNLNLAQTRVLNTWVSFRTSADISLKISTQLNYKTFRSISGQTIDTPHDYSEVNIATVYTSSREKYFDRIKSIVEKRLYIYLHKQFKAEHFFPPDVKQETEIEKIAQRIKSEFAEHGRGASAADDVKRYATPNYIRDLKAKRAGSSYSYAGFRQLVSISSGIIRYFLEPASLMFSEVLAQNPEIEFECIPSTVQDSVIKDYSDNYILKDFEKIFIGEIDIIEPFEDLITNDVTSSELRKSDKLRNLINGLGGLFHIILISNASERRVFSVALSSKPDQELEEILNLGVQYGYFHESTIGNKQGTGRTKLYILSRLSAPHFKLDPTSFAGYKFLKSEVLKEALTNPQQFISKQRGLLQKTDITEVNDDIFQFNLFE